MRYKIEKNKFLLIICESTTGIILTKDLNYFNSKTDDQDFEIFDTLEEAKTAIAAYCSGKHANALFQVFDADYTIVYEKEISVISSTKTDTKSKWWHFWK